MNILGNLIWVIFGGLIMAVEYIISGAVMCITIIGIPFGLQVMRRGRIYSRSDRMPLNAAQRNMDIHRRDMDCPVASGPRRILLHNHHRHTVRSATLQTDELCISTLRPHRSAPIEPQTGNNTKRRYLMPRYPLLSFKTDIFCYAFPRNAAISRTEAVNSFSASSCSKVICTR